MTAIVDGTVEGAGGRLSGAALALVPGGLTVYLAFGSGGYLPSRPAWASVGLSVVLMTRQLFVARPGRGFSRLVGLVAAALAAFAAWTLLSAYWSDAPSRALSTFDRDLLYLLVFVACASAGGEPWRVRWLLRGLGIGAVVVCSVALVTRLMPDLLPIHYISVSTRLSYPIGYWNGLGLLAALGLILCFGLTCSVSEAPVVRILSAAAVPLLATTVLLTLSRAAIASAILGLFLFAVLGHPRALLGGLLATVPAGVIALTTTYGADLVVSGLVTRRPGASVEISPAMASAGQAEGHHVALVLLLCVGGAAVLRALVTRIDDRVARIPLSAPERRGVLIGAAIVVTLGLGGAAASVDIPRQYDRFVQPVSASQAITRAQGGKGALTLLNNDERVSQWRIGLDQFRAKAVLGRGAGTYELTWAQHRPDVTVLHNGALYPEVLADLGLVGFILLVGAVVAMIVGAALRARGPQRPMYATIAAVLLAWAAAAATDYYWELPAITLWVFALGGAALAAPGRPLTSRPQLARGARVLVAAAVGVLMLLVPVRLSQSSSAVEAAAAAYAGGRCDSVHAAAAEAIGVVPDTPQPYAFLAGCALNAGETVAAVRWMRAAVAREPANAFFQYGLAVALAQDGLDPRGPAAAALRLDPREQLLIDAVPRLESADNPGAWRRTSGSMRIEVPPST